MEKIGPLEVHGFPPKRAFGGEKRESNIVRGRNKEKKNERV